MTSIERARWVPNGLQLEREMAFDAWLTIGKRILGISKASPWCIGDWLVYGQQAYGERYKTALETTKFDYQTLRNYAWVARRFEMSRRRDTLSFQHHAEVAALYEPEQDLWLERADRLRWSRNELRRHITARRRQAAQPHVQVTVCLRVTPGRNERWRQAAAARHEELADWIATTVDVAAEDVLQPRRDTGQRNGRPSAPPAAPSEPS